MIQILKLSDMDVRSTMIDMFKKTDDKGRETRELESVLKRKKSKNQTKIINLKNTITRTDLLQHDGVRRRANPLPAKQLQSWSKLAKTITSAFWKSQNKTNREAYTHEND